MSFADMLIDRCSIYRAVVGESGTIHAQEKTYPTATYTDVHCSWQPVVASQGSAALMAMREGIVGTVPLLIYFPTGTDVLENDKIVVTGRVVGGVTTTYGAAQQARMTAVIMTANESAGAPYHVLAEANLAENRGL